MVLGAVHPPAVAAGTVAALAITWLLAGRIHEPGAAALAAMVEPTPFLAELGARGLATEVFEGLDAAG